MSNYVLNLLWANARCSTFKKLYANVYQEDEAEDGEGARATQCRLVEPTRTTVSSALKIWNRTNSDPFQILKLIETNYWNHWNQILKP